MLLLQATGNQDCGQTTFLSKSGRDNKARCFMQEGIEKDMGAVPCPPCLHCHFDFSFADKLSSGPERKTRCQQSSLHQILELL